MRVLTYPPFGFEFGSVVSPERGRSIGCSQTNIDWSSFVNDDVVDFFPGLLVVDRELQRNNSILHSPKQKIQGTTSPEKKKKEKKREVYALSPDKGYRSK